MIDSTVYLATQDTVEFAVKIYEGEYGLMLETPKPLSGNLFGIKSSEGRLKYSFTFFDFINNKYQYIIYYNEFPSFWGAYYLFNGLVLEVQMIIQVLLELILMVRE